MAEDTTPETAPAAPDADALHQDAPIELLPDPTKPLPKPEAKSDDKPDAKAENATAYQLRKEKERAQQLETDLAKYKKREEDERKAKQTEQERAEEELAQIRNERDTLRRENLIQKIGLEARLPMSMWGRIQGADEDAMRADAADLALLVKRPPAGTITDPVRDGGGKQRTYTRSELQADPKLARSPEVAQAAREGRIVAG